MVIELFSDFIVVIDFVYNGLLQIEFNVPKFCKTVIEALRMYSLEQDFL